MCGSAGTFWKFGFPQNDCLDQQSTRITEILLLRSHVATFPFFYLFLTSKLLSDPSRIFWTLCGSHFQLLVFSCSKLGSGAPLLDQPLPPDAVFPTHCARSGSWSPFDDLSESSLCYWSTHNDRVLVSLLALCGIAMGHSGTDHVVWADLKAVFSRGQIRIRSKNIYSRPFKICTKEIETPLQDCKVIGVALVVSTWVIVKSGPNLQEVPRDLWVGQLFLWILICGWHFALDMVGHCVTVFCISLLFPLHGKNWMVKKQGGVRGYSRNTKLFVTQEFCLFPGFLRLCLGTQMTSPPPGTQNCMLPEKSVFRQKNEGSGWADGSFLPASTLSVESLLHCQARKCATLTLRNSPIQTPLSLNRQNFPLV